MALIETWIVTNNDSGSLSITDIITPYTVPPGQTKDLLTVGNNTADNLSSSIIIRNFASQVIVSGSNAGLPRLSSDYFHSHNEFSRTNHTHTGLDVLTAGETSDADTLHTHDSLITGAEVNILINDALSENINIDFRGYVTKEGSINQLSDITSTGSSIENAVDKVHDQDHSLLEHTDVDPITVENLTTLMDGSNADDLHLHSMNHNSLAGLQGGEAGEYYHLIEEKYNLILRLDEDSSGLIYNGISLLDSLWRRSGATLYPEQSGDNVSIDGVLTVGSDITWNGSIFDMTDSSKIININSDGLQIQEDSINWINILPTSLRIDFGSIDSPDYNFLGIGTTTFGGDVNLDSNSKRLYLGSSQDANIYFDDTDLIIGFTNPSARDLTQQVRINDDLIIEGLLTIGTSSMQIDGDSAVISSTIGTITIDSTVLTDAINSISGTDVTFSDDINIATGKQLLTETITSLTGSGGVDFNDDIIVTVGNVLQTDTITGTTGPTTTVNFTSDNVDIDGALNVDGDTVIDGKIHVGDGTEGVFLADVGGGDTAINSAWSYLNITKASGTAALFIQGTKARLTISDINNTSGQRNFLITNSANLATFQILNDAGSQTKIPMSMSMDTGDFTFGHDSTTLINYTGRLVVRTVGADPTGSATAGTLGEIVFYNDKWYGKTVDTDINTNWSALN